jgi:ribonuclease HII
METRSETEDSRRKKYFVGVDEAGYGPNLGPLVVAASLWTAPEDFSERDLCEALRHTFSAVPWTAGCNHVPLGDSKQLYQSGSGLATLEAGLLSMFLLNWTARSRLGDWVQFVVAEKRIAELKRWPWYAGFDDLRLPCALVDDQEIQRLALVAGQALDAIGVELIDMRAVIVTEAEFNSAVAASGSKGQLLSQTTLELVGRVLEQCTASTEVFCDRQGGRKNYLPNLLQAMPDQWFHETAVSPTRSSYRSNRSLPLDIHFSVGGDRFPPTALASMLAKYLRERLMEQLNAFWRQQVPGLRPTAGYPVDAKRFREEISAQAKALQLDDESWWRRK